ncbi:hypothetical protein, partial [Neptuniibacter sp. UBA6509]|uniref:hypothetical protein n=1 Tax=Neptuniibacter sp. UBA6509 TaxID=1946976 RepID=UPI0025E90CF5
AGDSCRQLLNPRVKTSLISSTIDFHAEAVEKHANTISPAKVSLGEIAEQFLKCFLKCSLKNSLKYYRNKPEASLVVA